MPPAAHDESVRRTAALASSPAGCTDGSRPMAAASWARQPRMYLAVMAATRGQRGPGRGHDSCQPRRCRTRDRPRASPRRRKSTRPWVKLPAISGNGYSPAGRRGHGSGAAFLELAEANTARRRRPAVPTARTSRSTNRRILATEAHRSRVLRDARHPIEGRPRDRRVARARRV